MFKSSNRIKNCGITGCTSLIKSSINSYCVMQIINPICKSDLLFNALVRYISNSYKSLNNHSSFLIEYNITVNYTGLNGCKDSELYENKTRDKCESKEARVK